MRYVTLDDGVQTLQVSCLAIGSAVKMGALSKQELFALYDLFIEAGGSCIDTARAYGGGQAELMIGEYIRSRKNRDRLVLCTKCCHPASDGTPRLTRQAMEEDLNASLQALGTDHLDLYWIHKDDPSVSVEEVIEWLNSLLQSGKIRMIGCSNWHVDRIERANHYAAQHGLRGFAASQIQWSLASSDEKKFRQFTAVLMDDVSYAWYCDHNMPVFAFSPQAQGFFSKGAQGGMGSLNPFLRDCYENEENLRRLARVKELAEARGVPVSVPVLACLIHNKLPCVPVFGATSRQMVLEAVQAADFPMTQAEVDTLFRPSAV